MKKLLEFMKKHDLKLATAESCTAGLIASKLGNHPGAGEVLDCAFVTYSPASKMAYLGVRQATIRRCNLTSEEVAREMAAGAIKASRANVAIANTGVTDNVDPEIPRGTQCFAWAIRRPRSRIMIFSETVRFKGSRNAIRDAAATYALTRLRHYVNSAFKRATPA